MRPPLLYEFLVNLIKYEQELEEEQTLYKDFAGNTADFIHVVQFISLATSKFWQPKVVVDLKEGHPCSGHLQEKLK